MDEIEIPKVVLNALSRARKAHDQMWHAIKECRKTRNTAISLARKHGLSVREIGKRLKLTGQRIGYLMRQAGIE